MQMVLSELHEGHAPITLQNAFHDALEALEAWEEGTEEPHVVVDGRSVPISQIFAHMSACTDLLPLRTRDVLETIIDKTSFRASGAALYGDGSRLVIPLCLDRVTVPQLRPTSSTMQLTSAVEA